MRNTLILTLVLAGLAMVGPFATGCYLPSFQAISQHFSVTPLMVQQTLSVYLAAFAFMTLFYGTLSDSFGRRPVILVAVGVFALASVGASMTNSFGMLLFFRGLQGACAGAGRVIGIAIVRDKFDSADAQRMISQIAMVFGVAPVVAPIIGGYLHVHYGWRASFVMMATMTIAILLASIFALPETLPREKRQAFHFGRIAQNYWAALRNFRFVLCIFAVAFSYGGFAVYIAGAPKFVMEILHLPETAFAWLFVPMVSGTIIGSFLVSRFARKIRPEKLIRIGIVLMVLAAILNIAYSSFFVVAVPWAVIPILIYSFGLAIATPGMTVTGLDFFPSMRGLASSLQGFGLMATFAVISGFIAPLIYSSALKLAYGMAISLALSVISWHFVTFKNPSIVQ